MPISKLGHFAVRTTSLAESRRFYVDALGLREGFRPEFKFPGHWLYLEDDDSDYGVVHLIGIDKDDPQGLTDYLGDKDASSLQGSGAIDHVAFLVTDLKGMRQRLQEGEHDFRERTVPELGLHQVFVEDPSGVTVELNFPASEVQGDHNV